jgi:hypothetical protein
MDSADKPVAHLEMDAVKTSNHTHLAVEIHLFVSQFDRLCQWQCVN